MAEICTYLESFSQPAVIIRLFIAMVFGGFIGLERITKKHNAGIKTFSLVSLGSAAATVLNVYLAGMPEMNADVSRIPAGVVSGIGFLGAGTILLTGKNQIKGLTTAATLWVTAMMGMVIGGGYLWIGTACFVLIMLANSVLERISHKVEEFNRYMSFYVEVDKTKGVSKLRKYLIESGYEILSMTKTKEKTLQEDDNALVVELNLKTKLDHQLILEEIDELEFVNYLEEL